MASARLVGLFILLLYSKDSYGQQGLEIQHLGLHVVGSPNVASCLSKIQGSNPLQNGQNSPQQPKLQQYNLQQQQQGPQQQQGFQQQQGYQQQQILQQQQQYIQQQQALQQQQAFQQQLFQQQVLQQSMNAQPNNLQTPAKQQSNTVQQPVNSQNFNVPIPTNPSFNLQFVNQKPQVFDCNSSSSTKSQPQGSQKNKATSTIPEIELTSLKFIPLDPNFSLQGNPDASLTFQIGSQVHQIPLTTLTQPTTSTNQNFQNQPVHTLQNQVSPQIQSVVQQQVDNKYTPLQSMPFTYAQSVPPGQLQNPSAVVLGSSSPILSSHKNQPTIALQNMQPPSYQDIMESLSLKYPPFVNFLQNPQIQTSIPNQSSLNPVPNQSSTIPVTNKPIAIFPVTQIPTIQPPQHNQLLILPINTQATSTHSQPLMTFSQMVPQPMLQGPQNQAMIASLQPQLQNQPVISSNSIQPIYQSQSIPPVSSFNNLAPTQNPYLSVQVQVPPAQNVPTIMSMPSPSFLPALENQQPWLGSQESGYSSIQNLPIVNPQSQPIFPFILPEYQTAFVANNGFGGKPKSSSLRSLLPILINILKENTNCRCPHCNGLYDDHDPNLFEECLNQRKSLPNEASIFSTFTADHEELLRSSRSEQNETKPNDSVTNDESAEENEDSSEYVDDNDEE